MNNALQSITFHQDTIFIIDQDGNPQVPIRPICENIGLDWASQFTKLTDSESRLTVCRITTVAADGKQREMLCMPLRKLNGWLMSISPKKVSPSVRPKLIRYQNECDDVLYNYFTTGVAVSNDFLRDNIIVNKDEHIALLAFRVAHANKKAPKKVSEDEAASFKADVLAGLTTAIIAKKYGRAKATIKNHTKVERKQIAAANSGQMMLPGVN